MTATASLAVILILPLILQEHNSSSEQSDKPVIDKISWLAGDWECRQKKKTIRETWSILKPTNDNGKMIYQGLGRVTDNGSAKLKSRESLLVAEMEGDVFYFAKVKHNSYPIPFRLTSCSDNHATFENPQHDFPKRLEYRLRGGGELRVKVSGADNNGFTLSFRKKQK